MVTKLNTQKLKKQVLKRWINVLSQEGFKSLKHLMSAVTFSSLSVMSAATVAGNIQAK